MNLYFVRHGETQLNKDKVYYGSLNCGLTEKGKEQALKVKELLKGVEFNAVYASERKRTSLTADLLLGENEIVKIDKRINEINFGDFEGKGYQEICETYPIESKEWENDWKGFCPPKGESYKTFYKRVESFMEEVIKSDENNILIVTHGGVIRAAYSYVLGGNLDFYWKFASSNGDVSVIKYEYGNLFIDSITHVELKS
jgi:alpha-ribazole phosphatase